MNSKALRSEADLKIRRAKIKDMDLYYRWLNDPEVRANSFHSEMVEYPTHVEWFNRKLSTKDTIFYLFELEKIPIGQVRIEKLDELVINISIDSEFRGRGFGKLMIDMALDAYGNEFSGSRKIFAYIKQVNTPSVKMFEKAGFTYCREIEVHGEKSLVMERKIFKK